MLKAVAEVAEIELPLKPQPEQLGTATTATWADRLLPFLVLMAVLLTGMVIPAAGLVDEKQRKTLASLTVTPVTLEEVYASKMLLGVVLGVAMAIIVLVMNGALGGQFGLLLGVLVFVAFAASVLGVLLGSYVDDQDAFTGFMKATGIVLYGPGLLELIPQAPEWVARIIPTYYLMSPVLEVSQRGASLADIAGDLLILAGLTAVMLVALRYVLQQQKVKVGVEA
jgi:ABC-2 type transport system permease protein